MQVNQEKAVINSKKFLELFEFAVLIALLGLVVYGVYIAVTLQGQTKEHNKSLAEVHAILTGRETCIIPIEEVTVNASDSAKIRK